MISIINKEFCCITSIYRPGKSAFCLDTGVQFVPLLNILIHENQKGFLAGRCIWENTRLLYDLIHYCNEKCKPGLVLLIDFEKSFDSDTWNFILKVLRFFNFGDNCLWCKAMCHSKCFFIEFFPMKRGCRQGDPISPYLFCYVRKLWETWLEIIS